MPSSLPIGASDYFEFFPSPDHRAGDIWVNLPTYGIIGIEHTPAVVITPACDLQNEKTETITYLPILSVRQAFATRGFAPEIVRSIDGQLELLGLPALSGISGKFNAISGSSLDRLLEIVQQRKQTPHFNAKDNLAVKRINAGVSILRAAIGPEIEVASHNDLRDLFGASPFEKMIERIVTNSYRSDCHFLPSDEQPHEWTTLSEPSVCLFRYPISAPIEILDAAQDLNRKDWIAEITNIATHTPCARFFSSMRPMKRQTLKPRFFADLLTRYVAMHMRLGAPDFTDESVQKYVAQVSKG